MLKQLWSVAKRPRKHNILHGSIHFFFKEWRLHKGLTQEQAAERAEMSVASISQLERGGQGPSDRSLAALAHAYDCEVPDLFRDPTRPDYQLWRIIKGMKDEHARERAIRLLKALAEEAV